MEDWNAKVGNSREQLDVTGPFGKGKMNINGERLLEFALTDNLKVAGTHLKKIENSLGLPLIKK